MSDPDRAAEREQHPLGLLVQWTTLGVAVGLFAGVASALFLWLLERATQYRTGHHGLVWALPVAGLTLGWFYERYGQPIRAGNNLVIDRLHDAGPELPLRMGPMVLAGTVLTHLFGGSAGREGTAVQMGASLADWLSHRLKSTKVLRRQLLAAGVAGGFGSVFGTPIAGTVFGLEFVLLGRIEYHALWPALVAALIGDFTTRALGIEHTAFPVLAETQLSPALFLKWILFAAAVALTTTLFIELTHWLKQQSERRLPRLGWRMAVGGVAVIALWQASGTDDFLGLGVPVIQRAFVDGSLPLSTWFLKLVFTAVTLGTGFLGGEVTPLFFIGATLGNALARGLGLPLDLAAGVGLASVFAAASNTPIALAIMALELLGARIFPHVMIVNVLAYLMTGHRSIYPAQRVLFSKVGAQVSGPLPLRELQHSRRKSTQKPDDTSDSRTWTRDGASENATGRGLDICIRGRDIPRQENPKMYKSPSHLPEQARVSLCETLNARLADGLDLHSQIKVAHWNIKGPQFAALHPLFETFAVSLATHNDTIAERSVTLGGKAYGTARHVAKQSQLPEYPQDTTRDMDHVRLLAERIEKYLDVVRESRSNAEKLGDTDTVDLFTQIVTEFEKHAWFLRASLES
ncbi:MAG TPA: DNA starvation/stationary phase protection protein Dps [Polyangiaceae bacterium]|nr:DNA starvation/stationary phase protection protein Dps [Polyangiaceae bacterium]